MTVERTRYELKPLPEQGVKSFYGKAYVIKESDGSETLFSYDTPIIQRLNDETLVKFWDSWSMTTGRHIKAFCGLNKKEYMQLNERGEN